MGVCIGRGFLNDLDTLCFQLSGLDRAILFGVLVQCRGSGVQFDFMPRRPRHHRRSIVGDRICKLHQGPLSRRIRHHVRLAVGDGVSNINLADSHSYLSSLTV